MSSSKPLIIPRWASSVSAAIVTPLAGKMDIGWLDGERPAAEYMNFLQFHYYEWIQYLADGNLFGNHTINGNLEVTGSTTLDGAVGVSGNVSVIGNVAVIGVVTTTGVIAGSLQVNSFSTFGDDAVFNGPVILATGSGGVVYQTGEDEHFATDREFSLDCTDFANTFSSDGTQGAISTFAVNGTDAITIQSMTVGSGNSSGFTNLAAGLDRIRIGDKITSILVCLARVGSPDGSERVFLEANGTTAIDSTVFTSSTLTRPSAGGTVTTTLSAINYTHVTNTALRLRVRTSATTSGSGGGAIALRWVIVRFQRP